MFEAAREHDEEAHTGLTQAEGGERAAVLQEESDAHRLDLDVPYVGKEGEDGFADVALERGEEGEAIFEGSEGIAGVALIDAPEFAAAGGAGPGGGGCVRHGALLQNRDCEAHLVEAR